MNRADTIVVPPAAIVCSVSLVALRIADRVERLIGRQDDLETGR